MKHFIKFLYKKFLFVFIFLISIFIFKIDTYATSESLVVPFFVHDYDGVNYSTGSSSSYTDLTMNSAIEFTTNKYFNVQTTGQILAWSDIKDSNGIYNLEGDSLYVRLSFCVTNNVSSGWSDNDYVEDVMFTGYNGIKCNIYGGGTGYLVQATYMVHIWKMGTNDFRINNVITTNVTAPNKITYLGVEFGKQPFPRYNADATIVSQNAQIIDILTRQNNNDVVAKINETNQKLTETNENLEKIDDTINNSNVDNPSSKIEEFENMLPENGTITQLITLPISLFQKVLNSVNGTCSQYSLGSLLGTELKLPCINISNYVGSTLWNVIDILFSGFFVLVIGKKMIKAFNGFTSMKEGDVLD